MAKKHDDTTVREAADLLGTSPSQIHRYIQRGALRTTTTDPMVRIRTSDLEDVQAQRNAPRPPPPAKPTKPDPAPDADHEWVTCTKAAELLGISPQAVAGRARRGTIPATWNERQWWFRADHLTLFRNAQHTKQAHP